jgi:hypothetical protein
MSYREFYSFLNHWINRLELRLGRGLVLGFSNAKPLQITTNHYKLLILCFRDS